MAQSGVEFTVGTFDSLLTVHACKRRSNVISRMQRRRDVCIATA